MKGMNLSTFKKMKEDASSATMIHKDGHTLVISKGALSPLHRKQLESLPVHNYADGTGNAGSDPGTIDYANADYSNQQIPENSPYGVPTPAETTPPTATADTASVPLNISNSSVDPQAVVTGPAPAGASPADPSGIAQIGAGNMSGFQEEKAANLESARAATAQGGQETEALQNTNDAIGQLPTQADIVNAHKAALQKNYDDYAKKEIDPDHYWQTHSKLGATVGLLLSGVGGNTNSAMSVIQNGIGRDIDAQKSNQDQKLNLWKMNREALGSDVAANLATQNQLYTGLKYKLDQTAAQAKGPQSLANAHLANAKIDELIGRNSLALGLHAGLTNQAGDGTEQSFVNNFNAASQYVPDMAKEAQAKYIPGVGVARVPLTPENRSSLTSLDNLEKQIDRGIGFAKTTGTTAPFTVKNQEANDIQNGIQLEIGNLVGLKRINEFEAKKYTDLAGNPGALRSGAAIQSLQDLKKDIAIKKQAEFSNLGVSPFRKAPADQVALQWARSNPNDPRAAQIIKAVGSK